MITQLKNFVPFSLLFTVLASCTITDAEDLAPIITDTGAQLEVYAPQVAPFHEHQHVEIFLRDSVAGASGVTARFSISMVSHEGAPAKGTFGFWPAFIYR